MDDLKLRNCLLPFFSSSLNILSDKIRACEFCSTLFTPNSRNQWFCSEDCRRKSTNTNNIEVLKNEAKVYQEIHKARVFSKDKKKEKKCVICEAPFMPSNNRHIYCSKKCQKKANEQRREHRIENKKKEFQTCEVCQTVFSPINRNHKFCSEQCRIKKRNKIQKERGRRYREQYKKFKQIKARNCKFCGARFVSKIQNQIYCSEKCQKKAYRERAKDKIKEYSKEYREKNKDKIRERNREYREENKEYMKKYREENKDRIRERQKEYYEKNKDNIKEHIKEYQEENKDKIKEYQKEYRERNKDKIREKKREYQEKNKDKIREKKREYRKIIYNECEQGIVRDTQMAKVFWEIFKNPNISLEELELILLDINGDRIREHYGRWRSITYEKYFTEVVEE